MISKAAKFSEMWVSGLIVVADQVAKAVVRSAVPVHGSVTVIPGLLDITHVTNAGAAFGILNTAEFPFKTLVMAVMAIAALVAVALYAMTLPPAHRAARFALALILGGAVGNLIDRAAAGFVVDFVDIYWREYHFWALDRKSTRLNSSH